MLEEIEEEVQALLKLQNNLKKSIYKKFRTETLQAKHNYAVTIYNDIEYKLIEYETQISQTSLRFFIKASREAISEIKEIIKRKLLENKTRDIVTMAPPEAAPAPFDIKTATALIQNYDGSPTGLEAFIDSVGLLADLTAPDHIATGIRFLKTRLSGKARSAVPPNARTFQEITDAVKQACKSIETPDSVLAKLKATKNKGDQQKFCDEVEILSQKLSTLYVENQIPADVANKMATKAGVDTLINGVSNAEIKIILKASEFNSVQKAIQKINETQPEQFQILSFNTRGRGRGNFRNNAQYSSYPRNRSAPNNDFNRSHGNNYQNPNRRGNGRGHNNYRGNFRGNYHNRGRNSYYPSNNSNQHRNGHGHNVFYAQAENCPVPQQMVVGGVVSNQPQTAQMHHQQQNQPVQLAHIAQQRQ